MAAPHYKGGGIVFGPRPKFDLHVRINRKERRAAIASLIVEKIKANRVRVLQREQMSEPKTKVAAAFFDKVQIGSRRVLVLGEVEKGEPRLNFMKSLQNLPKKEYAVVPQINGYALARCQELVVLDSALDQVLSILGVSHE